jgi:oligopeptide/dipeptide ABC transporter ATP-binding protein
VHRIGKQLIEVYRHHRSDLTLAEMERQAVELLQQVSISDPDQRMQEYPHQLSGGMRQRVMIAMALAGNPAIMIADEPTTALDVTIQAQILDLINTMQRRRGMAVIFITHDLGVVAEMCDLIVVMYAGQVAETGSAEELFYGAKHPYTQGLLASMPRLDYRRKSKLPVIEGIVPSLGEFPPGCRFNNRCPHVMAVCKEQQPPMIKIDSDHYAGCFLYS